MRGSLQRPIKLNSTTSDFSFSFSNVQCSTPTDADSSSIKFCTFWTAVHVGLFIFCVYMIYYMWHLTKMFIYVSVRLKNVKRACGTHCSHISELASRSNAGWRSLLWQISLVGYFQNLTCWIFHLTNPSFKQQHLWITDYIKCTEKK